MISAIKSVAILKASLDQNKDVIDNYVPFIANLAKVRAYEDVDVEMILRDFREEYGLQIPYHPMISMLNRCAARGIVRPRDQRYYFDSQRVANYSFASHTAQIETRTDTLIAAYREFARQSFDKIYSSEETTAVIIAFLQTYDADIILSRGDVSMLPQVDIEKKDSFIFYKFVLDICSRGTESYHTLVELAVGYLYASSVLFTQLKNENNLVRNLMIVLDTRLLLRLMGLEGDERKEVYNALMKTLKAGGAKLRVFEHTVEEIDGILEDCIRWVENPRYNPKCAGPALKHFVQNRYTVSDVVLFRANLESQLSRYAIRRIDGGFAMGLARDYIDEDKLYEMIVEEYTCHSDRFEEWSKKEVLYRDVKSVSAVARLRRGIVPKTLKGARATFVTTNAGLARAVNRFANSERGQRHMCECITDVLLGTLLWLDSPAVVQDLQYRRILADAVAALRPNENLVEKYRNELSKLKDRNEISEREYFYLRSHPKPLGRLEEKTFGDPNAFYDRLPEEILEELRNEIEMGIREETDLEIERQSKRISVLTTQLGNVQGDLKNMQESVDGARQNVERIANAITMGLSVLGSAIVVVLLLVSIHPARLLMWRLLFGVPLAAISALNLIFGFTVRAYFRPLRDRIRDRLLQAIDMD